MGHNAGTGNYATPQMVFASGVQAVSGGYEHSLFLKTDGSVWVAGSNKLGRVGTGAHNESVQLTKIVDSAVAGISAGKDHSIYWTTNGEVYVFGSNAHGQLGLPGRTLNTHEKQVLYDPNK
jgi:alpha-tubulin suppressor-like RCC1 family protein